MPCSRDGNHILRIANRITRYFQKNIASNYRIETRKKFTSVDASQNMKQKSAIF